MPREKRTRRGRGEASIYQRESDGKWVGSLSLGYDGTGKRPTEGRLRRHARRSGGRTPQAPGQFDAGRLVDTEELTTGEYLAAWLISAKTKLARDLRPVQTTHRTVPRPCARRTKLAKLRPLHVEGTTRPCTERTKRTARSAATPNTRRPRGRTRYRPKDTRSD